MNNLTFIIFTYNEEKRISYAIRNFIKYGDVIILDDGSTDKSKEIAENLGALFLRRPPSNISGGETQENLDFVKKHIKTDWIYWGYVDNIAPKTLVEKMVEISNQDKIKMVLIPLYTYLWGNTKNYAEKGYSPLFFHKNFIDFKNNYIHGMGQFTGTQDQKLKLPNKKEYALTHFSAYNIKKFLNNHLSYAETEAHDKYKAGKRFSPVRLMAAMIRYCWIFKSSLKDINLGFIIMLSYAFSRFMVYARLYELEKGITLESIEEKYSKEKEKILETFKK